MIVRSRGLQDYEPLWREMQRFTDTRHDETEDELWFTEHPPVYTLGLNADTRHLLNPGDIPVIKVDRGGQVTYHGPGQLMIYPLVDLCRNGVGVRSLVTGLEQAAISVLDELGISAESRCEAPGVYVNGEKIASVGLRIRRGASFHGMAFNIDVDVEPFSRINPCGFADLAVTNLRKLGSDEPRESVQTMFERAFLQQPVVT